MTRRSAAAQSFLDILSPTNPSTSAASLRARLDALRKLILLEGMPSDPSEASLIRPLAWKLLLRLHLLPPSSSSDLHPLLSAETYNDLASREPSMAFSKIRNDTFRTLKTDDDFMSKVGEERLVRLLEAFVWRQIDAAKGTDVGTPYVQGMNVLAAPFLYVLPSQLEAFACFTTFIEREAPLYVRPTLEGVHSGLQLVDQVLQTVDSTLHAHLLSHNLTAELYAFPSLLTFGACTPPLSQVIELWDFLLAWGVGLNVLCVVAQLWVIRDSLLLSTSPMKILRTFPSFSTREIVPLAVQFITDIPPSLYDSIVRHPWDPTYSQP